MASAYGDGGNRFVMIMMVKMVRKTYDKDRAIRTKSLLEDLPSRGFNEPVASFT